MSSGFVIPVGFACSLALRFFGSPPFARVPTLVAMLALVLTFAAPVPTSAHTRSQSFSNWWGDEQELVGVFTVAAREATRLQALEGSQRADGDLAQILAAHLAATTSVSSEDADCPATSLPRVLESVRGSLRVELTFRCDEAVSAVSIRAFYAVARSHVHFARVALERQDGAPVDLEQLLDAESSTLRVSSESSEQSGGFVPYTVLGIEHILEGWDHLAFVLTLLLATTRLRDVLILVLSFTIGHSVTLTLAALGTWSAHGPSVEALIGGSIALVAAKNVLAKSPPGAQRKAGLVLGAVLGLWALLSLTLQWGTLSWLSLAFATVAAACYLANHEEHRSTALRAVLVALFGLIHGFGFGSVLLDLGMPKERLLLSLFGFNLGVELGQLLVVAVALSLWTLVRTRVASTHGKTLHLVANVALCAVGTYWLVGRAFG